MQNSKVRILATCALLLAVALIATEIRLFRMPQGGSVTLFRMLWLAIPGYFFGLRAGFMTGTAYGLARLITATYVVHPAQFVLDYFLAFAVFGVSGFFQGQKFGLIIGVTLGTMLRIAISTISGVLFFVQFAPEGTRNFWIWSLGVNAPVMLTELAMILVFVLIPPVMGAIESMRLKVTAAAS
ncbi:MAG: energy-coupled thiamine transporter ThiT [Defluviitaleaceae bacterium]|nr:energy-coupled thiamine transporter ThiT [Defluviitaleaceae bacterium]